MADPQSASQIAVPDLATATGSVSVSDLAVLQPRTLAARFVEIREYSQRLSAVLDVARALQSSGSVDDVLSAAVDAALSLTGAERGFLMLQESGGSLAMRVARNVKNHDVPSLGITQSREMNIHKGKLRTVHKLVHEEMIADQ